MRQRRTKNLEEKIREYDHLIIPRDGIRPGHWIEDHFLEVVNSDSDVGNPRMDTNDGGNQTSKGLYNPKLFVEIGCGKGRFITTMAKRMPDDCFVAVEGQPSVAHKAIRLADAEGLTNVRFFVGYVDRPEELWKPGEVDGIFLNFSDPWPKKRHAKRRLTYHKRLRAYSSLLAPEGFIQFKTDNDGLFDSALEEIEIAGLEILAMTRDLHNSEYSHNNVMTEYEEKFSNMGEKINMVVMR